MADYTSKYVDGRFSGTLTLASGVGSGTVLWTFTALPTKVKLTVQAPADGAVLYATVNDIRANGFDFTLSGETPDTGYKLNYICDF